MFPLFPIPTGSPSLKTIFTTAIINTLVDLGAKSAYDHATKRDEEEFNRGKATGEQRAKAEYAEKLQRFTQAVTARMADNTRFYDPVLAVMTVGYAYAAARHGGVTGAMRTEIDEFVMGQSQRHFPPHLRQKLDAIAATPPDAITAHAAAMALAPDAMQICSMLIALLQASPDTAGATQGYAFALAWEQIKSAA